LKKSMTEMIQLTRHFHTLRNNGPADPAILDVVKNDNRKIQEINEVLYDHMQDYINSSGDSNKRVEDYINDVNKTSLDFTEQALDFLFQLKNNVPGNIHQTDRTVQFSYTSSKEKYHLYVGKIKAGIAMLSQGKNDLIKKLNKCKEGLYPDTHRVDTPIATLTFPQSERVEMEPRNYTAREAEEDEERKISPKLIQSNIPEINPEVKYKRPLRKESEHPHVKPTETKINNSSEVSQTNPNRITEANSIQNDTKHDNTEGSSNSNTTAANDNHEHEDQERKVETSQDAQQKEKTFQASSSMSSKINIEKIRGLLEESEIEPVKLKPLEEQDEKSDVIKEKMNQIRERMKNSASKSPPKI